jgi:hypothetical protein
LAEDALTWRKSASRDELNEDIREVASQVVAHLELDGYIYGDGHLYYSEAAALDTDIEEGIVQHLVTELALANEQVIRHRLENSENQYLNKKWDDSISNSRKFLEAILSEVAARHQLIESRQTLPSETYSRPVEVRKYLEQVGLLDGAEVDGIRVIYGLLSRTGATLTSRKGTRLDFCEISLWHWLSSYC